MVRLEELLVTFCLPFDWKRGLAVRGAGQGALRPATVREILLVGEIDLLVFDREGRVIVWDLKATKNNEYYRKVLGQLAFYALAVKGPSHLSWAAGLPGAG